MRFPPLRWPSLASLRRLAMVALAGLLALNLAACSGASLSQAKDAARTAANVAKTAADLTGNEQLKAAISPVLKVLNTTEKQVEAGNISAASSTMKTFRGLWDTAQPVVKLAAGPNYGLIDKGVKLVLNTFGGEAAPSQDTALAAVKGLVGPLSALLG
ncbi:MAG: hypothetical protein R6W06_02760 [Prochlorococcaceae cyanobacterium]